MLLDVYFFLDLILTFFVPFYHKARFVVSHKGIAINYIASIWFWIDLLSIAPIDFMMDYQNDYSVLLKFFKLPRFYKMVDSL